MSACPISLKYRKKQKSTLLCLWNICVFFTDLTLGRSQCSWARTFFPAAFVIFFSLFPRSVLPRFCPFWSHRRRKNVQKIWSRQSNKSTWVMDGGARHQASSSRRRCWCVWGQLYGACVVKSYSCNEPSNISILRRWMSKKPRSSKTAPPCFRQWFAPVVESPCGTKRVRIPRFWLQLRCSLKQEVRVIWGASEDINTLISYFLQKCIGYANWVDEWFGKMDASLSSS